MGLLKDCQDGQLAVLAAFQIKPGALSRTAIPGRRPKTAFNQLSQIVKEQRLTRATNNQSRHRASTTIAEFYRPKTACHDQPSKRLESPMA